MARVPARLGCGVRAAACRRASARASACRAPGHSWTAPLRFVRTLPSPPLGSSPRRLVTSSAEPVDLYADVRAEVNEFGSMEPHPVTLQDVLSVLEPWRAAKFIHSEMPIRFAERIQWIESIPDWQLVPELVSVHHIHMKTFRALRQVDRHPTLDAFTAVVQAAVSDQKEVVRLMGAAMQRLRKERGEDKFGPHFVDPFLDGFLLNRFGANVLMSQYLALANKTHGPTGIIDRRCAPSLVCWQAAQSVAEICEDFTGLRPVVNVQAFSTSGQDDAGIPRFPYIPGALKYMMIELLKNSCRATLDIVDDRTKLGDYPVNVVVCADEQNVAICTSDRARGIPFEVGSQVWSYLYSTARAGGGGERANELAGFGVGLPLSRLYARYLGGSLDLISLPGYGTHAYLFLPRMESEQLEVVPDKDHDPTYHFLSDHTL